LRKRASGGELEVVRLEGRTRTKEESVGERTKKKKGRTKKKPSGLRSCFVDQVRWWVAKSGKGWRDPGKKTFRRATKLTGCPMENNSGANWKNDPLTA